MAVELKPGRQSDAMLLYRREGAHIRTRLEPFQPFLWLEHRDLLDPRNPPCRLEELSGRHPLKVLAHFDSWKDFQKAATQLRARTGRTVSDPDAPYFLLKDPVQQFLMGTGRTLFQGLRFEDLRRLQVDIETYTAPGFEFSNPERDEDRIIAIALADQTDWTEVLSGVELDEAALIRQFVRLVRERDPDVIEGYNLFKFDLPYLAARARRHRVRLSLGRDGSVPRVHSGRFVVADRTVTYPKAEIYGRHVIDTYFLALIYDASHRSLEDLGLKQVAAHFGVSAPDRVFLEGEKIARTFDREPETVLRYARDDILETRALGDLLLPPYFVQAGLLPFSLQNVAVRGTGAKIDALLLREYLRVRHSIPRPDVPRAFEGGYTDIFVTGVVKNVHHVDVRSLYPSLLLLHGWGPRSDDLGVFRRLLAHLRNVRLEAQRRMQAAENTEERHLLDAMQTTFKVLINSFYGYLGFAPARFSDFDLAERVTAEGRALLKNMLDWLRAHGARPVEMDTDGIYFVPPPFRHPDDAAVFQCDFQSMLPEGIAVDFDGRYVAMFSYKMKNYALLDDHGKILIKGAALKSRGLEPFQRNFLREWLRLKLEERDAEIPELVRRYRRAIENREWPIRLLARTETLQDAPATYAERVRRGARGRHAAYELALKSGRDYRAGDTISYYITGTRRAVTAHEEAKLVSEWDPEHRDENVPYYLAKLDALCKKFDAGSENTGQGQLTLEDAPSTRK